MTLLFSVTTSTSSLWKSQNMCLHITEKSLGMSGLATKAAFKRNLFTSVLDKNSPTLKFLSNVNIYANIFVTCGVILF